MASMIEFAAEKGARLKYLAYQAAPEIGQASSSADALLSDAQGQRQRTAIQARLNYQPPEPIPLSSPNQASLRPTP